MIRVIGNGAAITTLRIVVSPDGKLLGNVTMHLGTPLRALLVSMTGVLLAWAWFHDASWWVLPNVRWLIAPCLALALAGLGLEKVGIAVLPWYPRLALWLMESWIITPAVIAAITAAVAVIVAVNLSVSDTATKETKQLAGALSSGIVGFLTSAFISWSGDQNDSTVSNRIRTNFQTKGKFKRRSTGPAVEAGVRYFKASSRGERLVFSEEFEGITGWGLSARWTRAERLAAEISDHKSDPDYAA